MLLACAAVVSGFSVPSAMAPPRTAPRAAAPTMAAPFDLTGKVAFVAGVADSTGCARLAKLSPARAPRARALG